LLTKSDGTKFGKTASGSVWLDADLTSPYAFYQYWISTDDRDVISFLKIFTFLSRTEIQEIEESHVQAPERRIAQTRLARELTTLVHGEDACNHVEAASQALFGRGDLSSLDSATLAAALSQVPQTKVEGNAPWGSLADLMAATGIVESKSAARRAIKEGGAYLNNGKIQDENFEPGRDDLIHGMFLVLRRGKREIGAVFVK
jgi:tyrosyl-tRNA synthetase